jgi:hypothetical protein
MDGLKCQDTSGVMTFKRGSYLGNTMFYMGILMSTLASTVETANGYSLLGYRSRPSH